MPTKSVRELLESNYDKLEAGEDPKGDPESDEEDSDESNEDSEGGATDKVAEDTPKEEESTPQEGTPEVTEGTPEAPAPAPGTQTPPTPAPPSPKPTEETQPAPGTWRPEAREAWKNIPKVVQEEIWKREREGAKALTLSTSAREFSSNFERLMQPYLPFIAAEGGNAFTAIDNVMKTATGLRVGTAEQKVNIVANICKNFGVNLEMLDSALAGEQIKETSPETVLGRLLDQRLAPIQQMIRQQQQHNVQLEQQTEQEIQIEVDNFASKHEFYWDVKDTMADLMELAIKRGQTIDLTTAYERATLMHEPVRQVIEARKQSDRAKKQGEAAARARARSGSITPSSETDVVNPVPKSKSIRDILEYNYDRLNTQGE